MRLDEKLSTWIDETVGLLPYLEGEGESGGDAPGEGIGVMEGVALTGVALGDGVSVGEGVA